MWLRGFPSQMPEPSSISIVMSISSESNRLFRRKQQGLYENELVDTQFHLSTFSEMLSPNFLLNSVLDSQSAGSALSLEIRCGCGIWPGLGNVVHKVVLYLPIHTLWKIAEFRYATIARTLCENRSYGLVPNLQLQFTFVVKYFKFLFIFFCKIEDACQ